MPQNPSSLWARVKAQRDLLPALYGSVDFEEMPERFTDDASVAIVTDRRPLGVDVTPEDLEIVRAYTLLGDVVADAYAALMPEYGFRRLIEMLQMACDLGVAAVPDAPPQLHAFLAAMEERPDWLDMELVGEGARLERNAMANLAPYAIRGAFLATFLNKYSALPMALTGTLGRETAARRVNETAAFFTSTVLPGALERFGPGFKAAAMVRLMHSMVRFNALRSGQWDTRIYGVPIPQVDQMPAGLIPVFLMAFAVLKEGRREFNAAERARVEFSRYRCFLLGLPEDLLASTPEGIVRMMTARNSTLRHGFVDDICGELIRATLDAYLPPDRTITNRVHNHLERRFAKVFFLRHFLEGDDAAARRMGIHVTPGDQAIAGLALLGLGMQLTAFRHAVRNPVTARAADTVLVRRLRRLLKRYGHAEYTTDAAQYRPTVRPAPPRAA